MDTMHPDAIDCVLREHAASLGLTRGYSAQARHLTLTPRRRTAVSSKMCISSRSSGHRDRSTNWLKDRHQTHHPLDSYSTTFLRMILTKNSLYRQGIYMHHSCLFGLPHSHQTCVVLRGRRAVEVMFEQRQRIGVFEACLAKKLEMAMNLEATRLIGP
jgi:hypothetical protein